MKREGVPVAVLSFALVCAAAAWGATTTIPMLLPGEAVESTLSPAGERKSVAYAGVEGSTIDIQAKALRGSRVRPQLSLLAPDGSAVDLGLTNPKSGGVAKARRIALGTTGIWRVGVETPSTAGGDFAISIKGRTPLKFAWTGAQTDAASVADHAVAAAPGGVISVLVAAKGKPSFDPSVELLAPSGASVAKVTGTGGRASIAVARLEELGRYTVRVTGGPGSFTAKATVKPAPKRVLAYRDVEAAPDVQTFSPQATTNDALVRFELSGFAFSTQQTVSVVSGTSTKSAGAVKQVTPAGAGADIDLSGVPPGTYSLRVATPAGNAVTAPGQLVVTNRNPGILSYTPDESSNRTPFVLDVRGAGFDATSTVTLRRVADGLNIPVTIQSRDSHKTIIASVAPPAWATGPCDLEVRDPDGSKVTVPSGVDILGFRAAPVSMRQYNASDAAQAFYPRDSVYDAVNNRVLLAIQEKTSVTLVLFDATTYAIADTLVLSASSFGVTGGVYRPRVAWDAVTGTFALGVTAGSSSMAYAFVRVVSANDLDVTKLQVNLAGGKKGVTQTTPAANVDTGGYLVVWEQWEGTGIGSKIKSQVITPALTANTSVQPLITSHLYGYLWEPVLAWQGNGRFVVAWDGATNDDTNYAVYAGVLDATGTPTSDGPYMTATATNWGNLFQPEITPNRNDGSMLLAFTYLDGTVYRPGVQRLAPVTASPGPHAALDADGRLPQGYIDSVRWNPARSEFVATMTTVDNRVAVRRINPDGTIRASFLLESYEGMWGILYSGPQAGQLGLSRAFDGTNDDTFNTLTLVMQALTGPLR